MIVRIKFYPSMGSEGMDGKHLTGFYNKQTGVIDNDKNYL